MVSMKKTILSDNQISFIKANVKTQTLTELSENVGLKRQTLTRLLKELGIIKKTRISPEEKTFIVTKYLEGSTLLEIAEDIGVSKTQVSAILKTLGVEARSQTTLKRKLKYNEFIFDDINTKEKAYFLGLFYADGYNAEYNNSIRLAFNIKDIELLFAFKEFMDYSGEIKFGMNSSSPVFKSTIVNPFWSFISSTL
jgi:DNA-binding MarR family transcriptional regulator